MVHISRQPAVYLLLLNSSAEVSIAFSSYRSSITIDCLSLLLSLYRYLLSTSLRAKVEDKGHSRAHSSEVATLPFSRFLLMSLVRGEGDIDLLTPLKEAVQVCVCSVVCVCHVWRDRVSVCGVGVVCVSL